MKNLMFAMMFIAVLLVSCNSTNQQLSNVPTLDPSVFQNFVKYEPPIEGVDVPYENLSVDPSVSQVLTLASGTKLTVPENVLVDENNQPVKEKVVIKYREITTPGQVIASGITMQYDSAGQNNVFQTAGMFELNATTEGGKKVFVAKGKKILVDFVSNTAGDYNVYLMKRSDKDTTKGSWSHLSSVSDSVLHTEDGKLAVKEDSLNLSKPIEPVKFDPKNDLIVQFSVGYLKFPELRAFKGLMWKYVGNKSKEEISNMLSSAVDNSELLPGNIDKMQYIIRVTNKGKTEDLEVSPVFSAKNYDIAMEKFQKQMIEYDNAKKQYEFQKEVERSIGVEQFGLYNCDRIYSNPDAITINCDLIFNNFDPTLVDKVKLFHITEYGTVIVPMNPKMKTFKFAPNIDNKLVAVLPGNKVAFISNSSMPNKFKISEAGKTPIKMIFDIHALQMKTPDDLDKIISSIN